MTDKVGKATPQDASYRPLQLSDFSAAAVARVRRDLQLSDAEMRDVVESINDGVRSPGDYFGLTPANANYLEDIALALYRAKQYTDAGCLYLTLLDLFPKRASAWRGTAACLQAQKQYPAAVMILLQARELAPEDLITVVLMGECYCLLNRQDMGVSYMRLALSLPAGSTLEKHYHQRAQAIIAANGHIQIEATAAAAAPSAEKKNAEPADSRLQQRLNLVAHIQGSADAVQLLESPQMREVVDRITDAVQCEVLTVREVAGFTDEQMRGAYLAACSYLEQGQALEAMKLCGWLIYLDARSASYYQLAGVAAHHLKLYCLADYFYGISLIYGPDNPATLIYRGEAKILSEERHAGIEMLKCGTAMCANKAELQQMCKRGMFLLQQFDRPTPSQPRP